MYVGDDQRTFLGQAPPAQPPERAPNARARL